MFSGTIPLFAKDIIMTDIKRKYLTDILNSLPTNLLQCYLVENQEQRNYDRVRVAATILRQRYKEEGKK